MGLKVCCESYILNIEKSRGAEHQESYLSGIDSNILSDIYISLPTECNLSNAVGFKPSSKHALMAPSPQGPVPTIATHFVMAMMSTTPFISGMV